MRNALVMVFIIFAMFIAAGSAEQLGNITIENYNYTGTGFWGKTVYYCNQTSDCGDLALKCLQDYDTVSNTGYSGWCGPASMTLCAHNSDLSSTYSMTASSAKICLNTTTYWVCSSGTWSGTFFCSSGETCSSGACSSSNSSSSSSSSGGVGGSTGSSLGAYTARVTVPPLTSGTTQAIDAGLKPNYTAVRRLSVTVSSSTMTGYITIDKISFRPSYVSYAPPAGKIYSYLEINLTNLTNSQISSGIIDFAVNKSWIAANSVDKNQITLYRYYSGSWNGLTTTLLTEETDNIIYRANTPGFSAFVIWAPESASSSTTATTTSSSSDTTTTSSGSDTTANTGATPEVTGSGGAIEGSEMASRTAQGGFDAIFLIIIVPIIVLAAVVFLYVYMKTKKQTRFDYKKIQEKRAEDAKKSTDNKGGILSNLLANKKMLGIIAAVIVMFVLAFFALSGPSSGCKNFSYFRVNSIQVNSTSFSIDLGNGNNVLTVTGIKIGVVDATGISSTPTTATSGSSIKITGTLPQALAAGSTYEFPVTIVYDVTGGIGGNSDSGRCAGTVLSAIKV
jgi:PGF-pre-PGF domain-containing protein